MTHRGARLTPDQHRPRIQRVGSHADDPGFGPDRDVIFARGVLTVWWLLFLVGALLEPAPDGASAEAAFGVLENVIMFAALAVLFAVTVLLARTSGGDARGGWAALGGGLFFLGLSLACPATDHHAVAGWWYGQVATSAGMVVAGLVAVRHARARR